MFQFFDTIAGYIELAWSYIIGLFDSIFFALTVLSRGTSVWTLFLGNVPAVIGSSIIIFMAIYLVKFLIGR